MGKEIEQVSFLGADAFKPTSAVRPAKAGIQYSAASVVESKRSGILGPCLRGDGGPGL
jgi:hypothetical protein